MTSKKEEVDNAEDPIEAQARELLNQKWEPELDEDGYAVGDPYADAAKMVDKARKYQEENPSMRVRVGKAILENQDVVSFFERYAKTAFAAICLLYMWYSFDWDEKDLKKAESAGSVLKDLTNKSVISDFASREGIMLVGVVSLYWMARWTNEYYDQQELDAYMAMRRERKAQKLTKGAGGIKEQPNESNSDDSSSDEDQKKKDKSADAS